MSVKQASLYIHIPFCATFCDYCDFYSVTTKFCNDEYIDSYLTALVTDIKQQIDYFDVKKIPTVYIGGGTPSVLGGKISCLLDSLCEITVFSPDEFTVEANPESTTEEFLLACREGGVNRLSLGIQTFHEQSRVAVNRGIGLTRIEEKIALVSKYFPDAFSADLITGLPFQNQRIVIDDINKVLEYKPSCISLYSLSVEDQTPLKEKIKAKTVILPMSDEADLLWLTGREALLNAGFEHYEVSNFSLPGKRCLHNINYWQMAGWLGAGPAASGTIIEDVKETEQIARRYTFTSDVDTYINEPSILKADCEVLDRYTLLKDFLLMGFRYIDGPDPVLFKQYFGCTVEECIPKTMEQWKGRDKMLFLNRFLSEVFRELDES